MDGKWFTALNKQMSTERNNKKIDYNYFLIKLSDYLFVACKTTSTSTEDKLVKYVVLLYVQFFQHVSTLYGHVLGQF